MHVELIVDNSRSNVRRLIIRESALVGRSEKCDIRIVSSEISREHCRFEVDRGEFILIDLGSTNGTFVNGVKIEIEQEVAVPDQSRIHVGPAAFKVNYVGSNSSTATPEETIAIAEETLEAGYLESEEAVKSDLPIEVQGEVEEAVSQEDLTLFDKEELASDEEEDSSLLAGIASDADMPIQTEETAFDDFLKGI